VEIHFAEALTTTINVIMYAEFDNVIEIDRNRHVLIHFSGTGVEPHITSDVAIVFEVGL
jgi:hypothetical protein